MLPPTHRQRRDEAGPLINPSGPAFFSLHAAQPFVLVTRLVDAGYLARSFASRVGLRIKSPPQFGHAPLSTLVAQSLQNVHSNEQIIAFVADGPRSRSQHSQFGLSSSTQPRKIAGAHENPN